MKTASLIQQQERKLERQKAACQDTEHMIRVLRRQLQEETTPTPLEQAIAKADSVMNFTDPANPFEVALQAIAQADKQEKEAAGPKARR